MAVLKISLRQFHELSGSFINTAEATLWNYNNGGFVNVFFQNLAGLRPNLAHKSSFSSSQNMTWKQIFKLCLVSLGFAKNYMYLDSVDLKLQEIYKL